MSVFNISRSLHYIITNFTTPFLKDEKWSKNFDPKLQNLLSELEAGLGSVVRRSDLNFTGKKFGKEDDILGMEI